jgi:hypothetical protein
MSLWNVDCYILLPVKIFLNPDLESVNQHIFPPSLMLFGSIEKCHLKHHQHDTRQGEHSNMAGDPILPKGRKPMNNF